jgi:hypothetical protein
LVLRDVPRRPGTIPGLLGGRSGKSLPGGKEATVISIIIAIAAVIAITVTVTIRFKRR